MEEAANAGAGAGSEEKSEGGEVVHVKKEKASESFFWSAGLTAELIKIVSTVLNVPTLHTGGGSFKNKAWAIALEALCNSAVGRSENLKDSSLKKEKVS